MTVVMGSGVMVMVMVWLGSITTGAVVRTESAVAALDDTAFHGGDLGCEPGSRFGDVGFHLCDLGGEEGVCTTETGWECAFFVLAVAKDGRRRLVGNQVDCKDHELLRVSVRAESSVPASFGSPCHSSPAEP